MTGQPAAKAPITSPPKVEYAKGKLDAPNTAMGAFGNGFLYF
jgi:hypothetical protein